MSSKNKRSPARREKLTKRFIDGVELPPPEKSRGVLIWDTELKGFALRVLPSGKKTFVLYYRANGEQRRPTIGTYGALTIDQAREIAKDMLVTVRTGGDPSQSRKDARHAPTMGELCERYIEEYARPRKKSSSVAEDQRNINNHVIPHLKNRKVAAVALADVQRLHNIMKDTPIAANRVLALLSKMFNLAERWSLRPEHTNPCRFVDKYPERQKHRALSELELRRLLKAISEWPNTPHDVLIHKGGEIKKHARKQAMPPSPERVVTRRRAADAILLILLTGCRRSEIAHLRWSEVDLEHRVLRLADSKSGPRIVYLNTAAMEVIERQERQPLNPHVFASPTKTGSSISDIKRPWSSIRELANLQSLRVHDLRHHAGEELATLGFNETYISKILGHKDRNVTRRYIDVAMTPLHEAAERYGETVSRVMDKDSESKPADEENVG